MKLLLLSLQSALILMAAPLLGGIMRKIKNNLRMRRGQDVTQPYRNLSKLLSKEEVVSKDASWLFRAAPYVVAASSLAAVVLVPSLIPGLCLSSAGDFIALFFVLALGRFFLTLAGLDTGSAFGGMGSSREVFVSSFAEPVAILAVLVLALNGGTTKLALLSSTGTLRVSSLIAVLALYLVTLAETSRIPIDNQETHLELTMIHEAMVLEYSGRSLALMEYAAYLKQIVLFSVLAALVLPLPATMSGGGILSMGALYAVKLLVLAGVTAVIEVSLAKLRLFRVPDYLAFALLLSGIALAASMMGM